MISAGNWYPLYNDDGVASTDPCCSTTSQSNRTPQLHQPDNAIRSGGLPTAPVLGRELGNLSTVPGDARWLADVLYRGVPQLTVIDPPLQTRTARPRAGCMTASAVTVMVTSSAAVIILRRMRYRTGNLPVFRTRDNSSPNAVQVRGLCHCIDSEYPMN